MLMRFQVRHAIGGVVFGAAVWAVAVAVASGEQEVLRHGQYKGANVIFIEMGDVRRDHLGYHGYHRPTSPRIDAWAKRAFQFEHVVAAAPWCVPGKLAIWTGLYPSAHGVVNKYVLDANGQIQRARLSADIPTFPELLKQRGRYTLVAFTGGSGVSGISGLNRAFDIYVDDQDFAGFNRTVPLAVDWLRTKRREPFFMFLQGYTAHGQAIPEVPYQRIFAPDYKGALTDSAEEHARFREESLKRRFDPAGPRIHDLGFSPEDQGFYLAIYDEKLQRADRWVGRFFDALQELGLLDRTIVVLFSGHGDEYFDHGFLDHGTNLYEEVIHVPLLMKLPGIEAGHIVESQVRTIDLFPTIFDLLGLSHHPVMGVSFLLALNGKRLELVGFSETHYRLFTHKSTLITPDHRYKLIYTHDTGERELYDLSQDPTEHHNLAEQDPRLAGTLQQQLFEMLSEFLQMAHDPVPVAETATQQLGKQ